MALFNYATKEITLKVVYYGPGLSGKTTNIQYLHENINPQNKGKLLSLATEADRTLFFDFLPLDLGSVKGFRVKFQLYTVPGQVRYNATRRLVLKGADAVVFVADSQADMREQNLQSFENMKENLRANGLDPDTIPLILQWNKRDLPNLLSEEELNADLNERGVPTFDAVAIEGTGVQETFKEITRLLVRDVVTKYQTELKPSAEPAPQPAQASRPKRQLRPRRFGGMTPGGTPAEAFMPGGGQMFDPDAFQSEEGLEAAPIEEIDLGEPMEFEEEPGGGHGVAEAAEAEEAGVEEAEELVPVEDIAAGEEAELAEAEEEADLYAVPSRPSSLEPAFGAEDTGQQKDLPGSTAALSAEMEGIRKQNEEILAALSDIRTLLRGSRKKWVRISLK